MALIVSAMGFGLLWTFIAHRAPRATVELEMRSVRASTVELGFVTEPTGRVDRLALARLPGGDVWSTLRFEIPVRTVRGLRLNPSLDGDTTELRTMRIVDADGSIRLDVAPRTVHAWAGLVLDDFGNGIVRLMADPVKDDAVATVAFDPIRLDVAVVNEVVAFLFASAAFLIVMSAVARVCATGAVRQAFDAVAGRHRRAIAALATAGALSSVAVVVAGGMSLTSPVLRISVPYAYEHQPTVPGGPVEAPDFVWGTDVGAFAWADLAYAALSRKAFDEEEWPLWNRFNGAGWSLLGQGQSMIGDPLHWLVVALGPESWSMDLKFVLLRIVFAVSIGLCVHALGARTRAAAISGAVSAFIGVFQFRVNHPVLFTLCYAPVLLLAWIHVARATRWRLCTIGVVAGHWLVASSGTVKEAYGFLLVLDATGLALVLAETRSLIAPRMRAAAVALAVSILVTAPLWAVFLDTLRGSWTAYDTPLVEQYRIFDLFDFADGFFSYARDDRYAPSVNMLLFLGAITAMVGLRNSRGADRQHRNAALVLACALMLSLGLAYGLVPGFLLLDMPLVRQIQHIDTTFSTIATVFASVVGGLGLSRLLEAERAMLRILIRRTAIVVAALFAMYLVTPNVPYPKVMVYAALIVLASGAMVAALRAPGHTMLRLVPLTLLASGAFVTCARSATWGDVAPRAAHWVLAAKPRTRLLLESDVTRHARESMTAPVRAIALGDNVFSGYRAAIGLESIDGPDALQNRRYRQLAEALALPYDDWLWHLQFRSQGDLDRARTALDFLNVGLVFSRFALDAPGFVEISREPRLRGYSRTTAWPRAFFTTAATSADLETLVARIRAGDSPFVTLNPADFKASGLDRPEGQSGRPGAVVAATDYRLTTNTTRFRIDVPQPGLIYLGENVDPGNEHATLDGAPVPILVANHAFKAIVVSSAGSHEVAFTYRPRALSPALACAALGLAMLAGWLGIGAWRARRSRSGRVSSPSASSAA